MRGCSEPDPPVVQRDDELPFVQLHVDLTAAEQHQRVDGHHAAVSDEDAARLHLLVVNQVGAAVVAHLREGKSAGWLRCLARPPRLCLRGPSSPCS